MNGAKTIKERNSSQMGQLSRPHILTPLEAEGCMSSPEGVAVEPWPRWSREAPVSRDLSPP